MDSIVADHGPSPVGRGPGTDVMVGGAIRTRPATRRAPIARSVIAEVTERIMPVHSRRDVPSRVAAHDTRRTAAPASVSAAAPGRVACAPTIAATMAPIAIQPLRPTSAHGDEIAKTVKCLLPDEFAVPKVLNGFEGRGFARGDDLRRGHGADSGQRVKFSRCGYIEVDRTA